MTSPIERSHRPFLPIAEIFTSIHGEGLWSGTLMTFVRLAGCSVGRPPTRRTKNDTLQNDVLHVLPSGREAWTCTTYDGREFPCDTDFHLDKNFSLDDILPQIPQNVKHVCLTGGEPLMHWDRLEAVDFFNAMASREIMVHVETSGTILPKSWYANVYYTCSPKKDVLDSFLTEWANEIRLLVDGDFDSATIPKGVLESPANLYLCPINGVDHLDTANINRAIELIATKYPQAKLSIQLHKVLGVR